MKRRRAAEPSGITGPAHTPPPSAQVGRSVSSSGLPPTAVGRAGGSRSRALAASAWLEQGSSGMLVISPCKHVSVFPWCLVLCQLPLGRLGPKLISVLWLDGFSTSCLSFFFFF